MGSSGRCPISMLVPGPNVRYWSWLCENSSARRARRNISKKLRTMESNRAARTMFDTLLENCIFYISQLYEFSHRLGQQRRKRSGRVVGLCPQHPQKLTKFKPWRRRVIGAVDLRRPENA